MLKIRNIKQPLKLNIEKELRVLVGNSTDVKIEISSGIAEVYGTQMELNREYSLLPHSTIAIFTWHGCVINLSGKPEAVYMIKDNSMILNIVLHASLEEKRLLAEVEKKRGPSILIVGENNSAKDMLCRLLLNYAVHLGRRPLFLNLDVGKDSISIPGTLGVLVVEKPADIVSGFDNQDVDTYQFGYMNPYENIMLYLFLLKKLGQTLQSNSNQTNQNDRYSGIIINSYSPVRRQIDKHKFDIRSVISKYFEIDILCVLHDENLYLQLQSIMPSSVKIIFIPKIDRIVPKTQRLKHKFKEAHVRKYFFGLYNQLQPYTFEVHYSDVQVFKAKINQKGMGDQLPVDITQRNAKFKRVKLSEKLVDHVLGLSIADDVKDISCMRVIGYICVTSVDIARNTITVLSLQPSPLSKKILLAGNIVMKANQ